MSGVGTTIVQLIGDFVKGESNEHGWGWRFLAAWWGSATAILSAYVTSLGEERLKFLREFAAVWVVPSLIFATIYASSFALIIAFGVPKGSLLRHFMYGVVLPAVAWVIGATMIGGIGGNGGE